MKDKLLLPTIFQLEGMQGRHYLAPSRMCRCLDDHLSQMDLFVRPCSGLDSTSARDLMELLHYLAMGGRTLAATIHQPSQLMFARLDIILLLSRGEVESVLALQGSRVESFRHSWHCMGGRRGPWTCDSNPHPHNFPAHARHLCER